MTLRPGLDRRWFFLSAAWTAAALLFLSWGAAPLLVGGALMLAFAATVRHERLARRTARRSNALLESKIAELQRHTESVALLGTLSDRLQTVVHGAEAHATIAESAQQLFPLSAGALCTVDPALGNARVVASWGRPATRSHFATAACHVLRGSGGAPAGLACAHLEASASVHTTCLPVVSARATLGLICIDAPAALEPDPFRATLAVAFAEQVGLALTNIRLKETLRGQAIHDPLTGLYNRRFLDENLRRELQRAARVGGSVGVLMLDLDDFKAFNDTHGHAAGDALLRAFAARLGKSIRAADIACRYGGEEFAVILPDATLDQSFARAEQVRVATRAMSVVFEGAPLPGVTISIGVAAWPKHGRSPDALMRAADAALYAAKASGRDRAEIASVPAVRSGAPDASASRRWTDLVRAR